MDNDLKIKTTIAYVLRYGVLISALIVLIGMVIYLNRHEGLIPNYSLFVGIPTDLKTIDGIFRSAFALSGEGILQLGILLLLFVPFFRVVASLFSFLIKRDWLYVCITLLVALILTYSFLSNGT